MADQLRKISFDDGETRLFEGGAGQAEIVNTPHGPVGRGTFLPGWRWSEHVKPIAGTDSCRASHVAYVVSGRMTLTMDDGTSQQFGPGDLMIAAAGHDAAVDGDEPCVIVDWEGAADYARRPVLSSFTRLSDDD